MAEDVIVVKDLVKRYGDLAAVDGVDFSVCRGEVFSILGPNGAGKTTMVEIIECLRSKTSGTVHILGLSIDTQVKEIKKRIGVLPQAFNSFDLLTVKENLEYFGNMYDRHLDADELIDLVELRAKRDVHFKNLSGGLKQRVGVAISMVNDPDIVFLDEPTTGLDPKARREVWEVIKGLRGKGKTVILTTHYMEEAEVLSDRVAIMDSGKFIALGTPRELIDEYGTGTVCIVKEGGAPALAVLKDVVPTAEMHDSDVHAHLDGRRDLLPEIIKRLESNKVFYDEIQLKRSTLEDVFLELTGKRILEA